MKRLLDRAPLPEGAVTVTIGVVIAGIAGYGFLVLAGRAVGPSQYADISVLWVLGFVVGPGVFMPLEQEVSRAIAARRARGVGALPVLRRAVVLGAAMLGLLLVVAGLASGPITRRLFDHNRVLFLAFASSLASLALGYLGRGYLSGNGKFRAYSVLVATESMIRLIPVAVFAALGVAGAGAYGLAFGLAPLLSAPVVLSRERGLLGPGPEAPWGELTTALGYLVAASLMSQLLLNLAPLGVKVLSSPGQKALVGVFLAGLVLARIPVVLFQAVLAALLPKLARLAATSQLREFEVVLRRLLGAVLVLGAAAIVASLAGGQFALHLLFGPSYTLSRGDFGLLTTASIVFILALTLGQGLIALRAYALLMAGWVAGAAGFLLGLALAHPLLLRAELGFLVGSSLCTGLLGASLVLRLRRLARSPAQQPA